MSTKDGQISDLLRCPQGQIDLSRFETDATPGFPKGKDKDDVPALKDEIELELEELQEKIVSGQLPAGRLAQPAALSANPLI